MSSLPAQTHTITMKRNYELTIIFAPVLKEKGMSSAIAGIEALVKKAKGKVSEMVDEGKLKLAFPIDKYKEGIYVFWKLAIATENVHKFEQEVKHQKGVLRHLLVRVED